VTSPEILSIVTGWMEPSFLALSIVDRRRRPYPREIKLLVATDVDFEALGTRGCARRQPDS
jgi:hypothetical protein